MKKNLHFLLTALIVLSGMMCLAQTDYSTTYTSNVTLSTTGGTSASACKVDIGQAQYDGIKAGTGSVSGAWKVTVPSGTQYLHLHVAAWKNTNVTLTVNPSGLSGNIALTSDQGMTSNSPFTFSGDPSSSDFYKVITFSDALTEDTDMTFTATGGTRFVVFGVQAEDGGSNPPVAQTVATPTFSPDEGTYTALFSASAEDCRSRVDFKVKGARVQCHDVMRSK